MSDRNPASESTAADPSSIIIEDQGCTLIQIHGRGNMSKQYMYQLWYRTYLRARRRVHVIYVVQRKIT